MQHLPWAQGKTVVDILRILLRTQSLADDGTTVLFVGKQRMTDMRHVYAYLVRATGLQPALNKRHVRVSLQHAVVRHSVLGEGIILKQPHTVDRSVAVVTCQCPVDRSFILIERTPY